MSFSNSTSFNNIELRVLLGPQAGAALALADADMVIGSDRECDIILQGAGVASRHALLSFTADNFSLTAMDGDITSSSELPTGAPWPFGTTVYLGDVGITLDRNESEWNNTSPPQNFAPAHRNITKATHCQAMLQRYWKRMAMIATLLLITSIAAQLILPSDEKSVGAQGLSPASIDDIKKSLANHRYGAALVVDIGLNDDAPVIGVNFLSDAQTGSLLLQRLLSTAQNTA